MSSRNDYMLRGSLARRGYDWWWHSLVGKSKRTGAEQPFFIEYYVINPALGGAEPILGQHPESKRRGLKPSYAMLKAGTWAPKAARQIHNFFGIQKLEVQSSPLAVRIGDATLSETHLEGSVAVTPEEAAAHPELMCDGGRMSWKLEAEKVLHYDVGFGASAPFRAANAFQMFWHVEGMLTRYRGSLELDGEGFEVDPATCGGYQDKNWGTDYTSPWVWLSCNRFRRRGSSKVLELTSLDVGGAQPVLFGRALERRLLVAFHHEGTLHEFNFSKFWTRPGQRFDCHAEPDAIVWKLEAWNSTAKVVIDFRCARETMLKVNYENPDGEWRHKDLWNGGWGQGTLDLYRKTAQGYELAESFDGELAGCEYGEESR
ncbi:MAG: tocopherol cyclase family protein [Myxococcales bacterium]